MTIRLYFDEDSMDRALLHALRARGIDVTSALDAGLTAREDSEHLAYAAAEGRTLVTFNVGDFCRLHEAFLRAGQHHAGIICARQQTLSIGDLLRRIIRLAASLSAEEMRDRVEFLGSW